MTYAKARWWDRAGCHWGRGGEEHSGALSGCSGVLVAIRSWERGPAC